MKNLVLISLCAGTVLVGSINAIFLGPIAVGLGVGAVLLAKSFIIGAIIAGNRSGHHSRGRRSTYSSGQHYSRPSYYYTQPSTYYYSSTPKHYNHHNHRGKRSAPYISHEEVHRLRREAETFEFDDWVLGMSSKDQDDCSKRLICELSAKMTHNKDKMTTDEITIATAFGTDLDIKKGQVEMNLAAEIGRTLGQDRCKELYKRCDTSLEDMLAMISMELEEMNIIEQQINGLTDDEIQENILEEKEDIEQELKEAGKNTETIWD